MNTECGFIAIYSEKTDFHVNNVLTGLKEIQHRGQDSCGITLYDPIQKQFITKKQSGLVKDLITTINKDDGPLSRKLTNIKSNCCVAHVRYTTSGNKDDETGFQPLIGKHEDKHFALVYNGNIPLMNKLYPDINLDSKGIVRYLEDDEYGEEFLDNLKQFLYDIQGAFCLATIYNNCLYIARDKRGFKPLSIGSKAGIYCVASESIALEKMGFENIKPFNSSYIEVYGMKNNDTNTKIHGYSQGLSKKSRCLFEYIYFMREQSIFDNIKVEDFRINSGIQLAKNDVNWIKSLINNGYTYNNKCIKLKSETKIIVVGCPNTGIPTGRGYAEYFKDIEIVEYKQIIKKRPKVNRTFILPDQDSRIAALKQKYDLDAENIRGNIIVFIDDSVVRGNTMDILLEQLWECKPLEIHVRIASPPVISECYFGIDIPTKDELIYNHYSSEKELSTYYCVDSFKYLDVNYFVKQYSSEVCTSCFTGKYDSKLLGW